MYIVDKTKNEIKEATHSTFSELHFSERKHLQEWIAQSPSCLGEDLLIIQKEFAGFEETKERLDLLAIDKNGNIVVIENKLDDSGKDVTWQAIKYASYCSSLKKSQIINIYKEYLESIASHEDAIKNLINFFETADDIDELSLNEGNSQRIILVAANFRKEVTSSVLWLRDFGVDISCVKVSPFKYGDAIMVDFDQIIPTKDTEDYMISIGEKKREENNTSANAKRKHNVRYDFWKKFIEYNKTNNGPYAASTPVPENWMGKGGVMGGVQVNIVIATDHCRTEIYFNTGNKEKNKNLFDSFQKHKEQIEKELGELSWERLDENVTCRICTRKPFSYREESQHENIFIYFIESTRSFIKCFHKISNSFKKQA